MATAGADQPTGLVNLAGLISSLAPIFLGSGKQTTVNSGGSGTQSSTSTTGNSPDVLSQLTGQVNTALSNAGDTSKTDALVANIMHEAALAFAPTLASGNSAGLYNTSSLSLLSSEAKARATAASSKAVLDYQTGQQQIAQQGLATIAGNNKTNTTNTVTNTPTTTSVTSKSPTVDPLTSLLTLGGGVLANKLLGTGGGSAGSSAADFLGGHAEALFDKIFGTGPFGEADMLGNTVGSAANLGGASTSSADSWLSLSGAPGANFTDAAGTFSGAPASLSSEASSFSGLTSSATSGAEGVGAGASAGVADTGIFSGNAATLTGFGGATGSQILDALPILGAITNSVLSIQNDPNGKGGNSAFGGIAGTGIGGVLGGPIGAGIGLLLGSLGGNLIGPGPQNAYTSTKFGTTPTGALSILSHNFQGTDTSAPQETAYTTQAATLNRLMSQYGFQVAGDFSSGLPFEIGTNTAGKTGDPNKFYDFATPNSSGANALSKLSFSSPDEGLNSSLSGKSFSSFDELATTLQQGAGGKAPDLSGVADDAQKLLQDHADAQTAALIKQMGPEVYALMSANSLYANNGGGGGG